MFVGLTPVILFFCMILTTFVQLTSFKEKLEYTTYVAARAAVVSADYESALENAKKVAEMDMAGYANMIEEGSIKIELNVIEGPVPSTVMENEEQDPTWRKGNYIECVVSARVKPALKLLQGADAEKKCKMIMLIEISK